MHYTTLCTHTHTNTDTLMHTYVCTYRVRNVIHRQHSSRIHTHAHTHSHTRRVTNAPTYTHTHKHTDTFAAVTRATTFVRFRSNIVWYTNLFEFHSFSNLQFGPFQFLPHVFFSLAIVIIVSLCLLFYFTMDAAATFVCSFLIFTHTHTHTHSFEMIPFPAVKSASNY